MQTTWLPTEEEIEAEKARIRSEWTEADMLSRGRLTLDRVTPGARKRALERRKQSTRQSARQQYLKRKGRREA